MPRYFLTLPIRSGLWTSLHFAYGVGVLAILAWGLAGLHVHLFGPEPTFALAVRISPWKVALCTAAFGALLEGVFLLAGNARSPMLTIAALAITGAVFAGATALAAAHDARWAWIRETAEAVTRRSVLVSGQRSALEFNAKAAPGITLGGPPAIGRGMRRSGPGPATPELPAAPLAARPGEEVQGNAHVAEAGLQTAGVESEEKRVARSRRMEEERQRYQALASAKLRVKAQLGEEMERTRVSGGALRCSDVFQYLTGAPISYSVLVWVISLLLGYILARVGTVLCRHGVIMPGGWRRMSRIMFMRLDADHTFASPGAAATWFEWKRFGRYHVWATCGFALSFVLIWVLGNDVRFMTRAFLSSGTYVEDMIGVNIAGLLLCTSCLGIYMTLRHHWDHTTGFNAFLFTLPVSTRKMASARLGMAARSVIISLLAVGTAILVVLIGTVRGHNLLHLTPYDLFIIPAASFAGLLIIVWLAIPIFYGAMGVVLIMSVVEIAARLRDPALNDVTAMVLAVVLIIASLWTIWRAHRAGILLNAAWLVMLALSSVAACASYVLYRQEFASQEVLWLLPAAALLSTVPFAAVPLSIRWYRHR
jgi:hypothetical protein